jgi:hypothetical protein
MAKSLSPVEVETRLAFLRDEHAKLEGRLKELERHLSLTPDEQLERARLKKAKLQLKDDMMHLQHTLH